MQMPKYDPSYDLRFLDYLQFQVSQYIQKALTNIAGISGVSIGIDNFFFFILQSFIFKCMATSTHYFLLCALYHTVPPLNQYEQKRNNHL